MISKVIVPAAGKGTRMKHLTKKTPKPLIEVNGKPFLYYQIKLFEKAGFDHIILVVGHFKEQMEEFVKRFDFQVTIVNQFSFSGEDKLGTALPILACEEFIGNDPFCVVNSDGVFSVDDLARMRIDDKFHYIGAMQSDHPEDYGVIYENDKGILEKIVEKPKNPESHLVNTGLYKFTPEIFAECKKVQPSARGEYELTDAVTALAEKKKVKVVKLKDYWYDFGRPEDVVTMSEHFKKLGEL